MELQGARHSQSAASLAKNSPGGLWFGVTRAIVNVAVDGLFYHAVEHEGRS